MPYAALLIFFQFAFCHTDGRDPGHLPVLDVEGTYHLRLDVLTLHTRDIKRSVNVRVGVPSASRTAPRTGSKAPNSVQFPWSTSFEGDLIHNSYV